VFAFLPLCAAYANLSPDLQIAGLKQAFLADCMRRFAGTFVKSLIYRRGAERNLRHVLCCSWS